VASLSLAACPKSLSVVTDTKYTHVVFVSDQPSDLSVVLKYAQLHLSGYGRFLSSHFQLMMGRNSNVFQAGRGPLTTKGRQIIGFGAYHPPPGPWARPVPTSPVRTYLLQAMYVFLLHGTVDNIISLSLSLECDPVRS
jgi:hypothetical protein